PCCRFMGHIQYLLPEKTCEPLPTASQHLANGERNHRNHHCKYPCRVGRTHHPERQKHLLYSVQRCSRIGLLFHRLVSHTQHRRYGHGHHLHIARPHLRARLQQPDPERNHDIRNLDWINAHYHRHHHRPNGKEKNIPGKSRKVKDAPGISPYQLINTPYFLIESSSLFPFFGTNV